MLPHLHIKGPWIWYSGKPITCKYGIRSFFGAASTSSSRPSSSSSEDDADNKQLEPRPLKKHCSRKYIKKWEKPFLGVEFDEDYRGVWITKQKAVEKMKVRT